MRRKSKKTSPGDQFLEKGMAAVFLGCGLLIASMFLRGSAILQTVAQALRTPAWFAIALGVVLIGVHRLILRHRRQELPSVDRPPATNTPARQKDFFPPDIPPPPGNPQPVNHEAVPAPRLSPVLSEKQQQWSKAVFNDIEWRRFEAVCERLFAQAGFETKSQSHGADGGVDIWLHSKNADGPVAVVQCKHWLGKPVGVKELREFFGVMASKGLKRGTFATSSTFSPAALEFARDNGINALDVDGLLALIGRRSVQQQKELLAIAYEGEYSRPTCASCGMKMTVRVSSKDGSRFWGCVNFPRCRNRLAVRA